LLWFVGHVLALVCARARRETGDLGSNPSPAVHALANDAINVSANVSDAVLHEPYRTARVAAVPLRCGAGVRLKVVEAMREGLPLVTTPIGG
jgi:glycosyltransferase involved in cell wall biosynthesis